MRRSSHLAVGFALLFVLAVGGRLGWLTFQVRHHAGLDEAQQADVIVVLGAAEYRGKPSPVLKARLDHSLDLYRRQLASRILTTGGAGGDPDFTEGGVGRDYLVSNGVPLAAVLIESEGSSTLESTIFAARIMRQHQLNSCIVVTDDYHVFRAKKLLEDRGLTVYGSPRPSSRQDDWDYWKLCMRQAVGYFLWTVGIKV